MSHGAFCELACIIRTLLVITTLAIMLKIINTVVQTYKPFLYKLINLGCVTNLCRRRLPPLCSSARATQAESMGNPFKLIYLHCCIHSNPKT